MRNRVLAYGLCLWCSLPVFAETVGAAMEGNFAANGESILEEHETPGMAISVVHGGEAVYSEAFGVTDIDTGEATTTDKLFHWASVTKPFVATAIMQLVEAEKIELDETVVTYLPYFELADERYKGITVRQMLTHTSGMPNVTNYEWRDPVFHDEALEEYVRSLSDEELIAAPGEKFQYSNMAFEVLGDLIAKVSGQPFETYVHENIFTPLGMDESTLLIKETTEEARVSPHTHTWRGTKVRRYWPYNRKHAPSSTLISNVEDMSRWMLANLNRGELDGVRMLDEASYELLWSRGEPPANGVGLSWFISETHGYKTVQHMGGDDGFATAVVLVPELSLGVAIVFNTDEAPRQEMLDLALAITIEAAKSVSE